MSAFGTEIQMRVVGRIRNVERLVGAIALTCLVLVATTAGPTWAKEEVPGLPVTVSGDVEVGGRTTWGDDHESQFERYRDLGEGVWGSFDLLFEDDEGRYYLRGKGENPGYEDQRYEMEFGRYGKFEIDLFYRELPQVFSNDAMSLYTRLGGNEYRLPAGTQAAIAGAADPANQLALELQNAGHVDLRFRQFEGGGGVEVHPIEGLTLFSRYRIQDRQGSRAMAIDWGSPGGNFVNFAAPVDDQLHEVSAGGEYAVGPANFGIEYLGSFYENQNRGATVDNPLVATDVDGASSRGRTSLDPDNSAHMVNLSASSIVPIGIPARVTGTFAFGVRLQDENFLPHTVNTALVSPTLPQSDLDGKVYTLLANLVATARPTDRLNLTARYRFYDYDNRTDRIRFDEKVENDDAIDTTAHTTVPNDYTTHTAEASAAYSFTDDVTGHLGYEFEKWRRSSDRQVRNLTEHGPNAKVDWRIDEKTKFQASYGFRMREGSNYRTYATINRILDTPQDDNPAAETRGLKRYDQADRYGQLANAWLFLYPSDTLEMSFNGGVRYWDYNDSRFGVQDELSWFVGWDAYWQACERMGIGTYYSYEKTRRVMKSRWRPRDFASPPTVINNPVNDWRTKMRTRTHTAGINFDVMAVPERLDLRFGYEINYAWEKTDTSSPPGSQGIGFFSGGDTPYDYPTVKDILQVVSAEAITTVSENVKLRTAYRYEDFLIRDYRTDNLGPYRGGEDIFLADTLDDYQAHILTATVVVTF